MSGLGQFIVIVYSAFGLLITAIAFYILRNTKWRWPVTVLFVAGVAGLAVLPFAEERHIQSQYEELCKTAGVHVLRRVVADGYIDERSKTSALRPGAISHQGAVSEYERRGYKFYERPVYGSSKVSHIEKLNGQWMELVLEKPVSRYAVRHVMIGTNYELSAGHRIWKNETVAIDLITGEVVGRELVFKRISNTVDDSILGLFGSTLGLCHGSLNERDDWKPYRLVEWTLIPVLATEKSSETVRSNPTVETDAREGGARGSP